MVLQEKQVFRDADMFSLKHTVFVIPVKCPHGVFQWTVDLTEAPDKELDWRYGTEQHNGGHVSWRE